MEPGTLCIAAPSSTAAAAGGPGPGSRGPGLEAAAGEFQKARSDGPEGVDRWCHAFGGPAEHAELFRDIHRAEPQAAERLAQAVAQMPEAGTSFQGFRLVEELGRGAFGRVFLARQGDLAGRPVVVKVAANVFGEAQALAQLQHTNIVPIYSVHRSGPLQAVCMPFLGSATLADVLTDLHTQQRLPHSGMTLVSTLYNRKSPTRRGPLTATEPGAPADDAERADGPEWNLDADPGRPPPPILTMLKGLDYVQAILWVASRIADGLAHAHERGILHRDLKPANILLSDEGQPMLLDFGVAEDTKRGPEVAAALIGGTLPYMAPEHLDACRGGPGRVTAASDVYSLGVILYELLTGRHPFPTSRRVSADDVGRMIADRSVSAPAVRNRTAAVSPAVESIIRHCLHPDPRRRYQSARQLQEDLQRHLQHLPLRHAPEPSLRERARKWVRRHPRVASTTTVALVAGALLLGLAGWSFQRGQRLATLEAMESLGRFREDVRSAQLLLNGRAEDRRQTDEGVLRCRRALDQYQVLDNAGWQALPAVRHLPESEQGRLRDEVSDLLLLLARATGLSGVQPRDPADAGAQLQLALRLNERAAAVASGEKSVEGEVFSTPLSALNAPGVSRALWTQRAELTRLLGRPDEARGLLEQARKTPLRTAKDRYLVATEHAAQGRYREAIPLLQEAVELDPKDFWAWFVLGHCHSGLAQAADAVACYNAAVALWPDYPWAYFNRGLAHLKLQNYRRAAADLDRAVHLKPDAAEPYLNRALARQGLKDYAGTVADLTRVLDLDPSCTRAYFMRARARELAGDAAGAKRDLEQGLSREPADEHGWVARGLARLTTDLAGALGDFDKALEFNPRSLAALQNKAHVLGRLNRTEEAVRVLDRAVELYPDFVPSRAGRGVYHGRLGHRAEALADAKESLLRDTNPSNVYQVAGIYALTSRQEADDRHEAFRLLASALRKGFGFDLLESDPDLNPIRKEPEFRRLVDASRSVSANATPKGP